MAEGENAGTVDLQQLLDKADSHIEKTVGKKLEVFDNKLVEIRELLKTAKGEFKQEDIQKLSEAVEEIRKSLAGHLSQFENLSKRVDIVVDEIITLGGKKIGKATPEEKKETDKTKRNLTLLEIE